MGPSPRPLGLYGLLCTSLVEMNGFGPTSLGVWIHSFLCFSRHVVWKGERPWLRQVCLWPLVEVEPRAPSQCANTWRPKLPSVDICEHLDMPKWLRFLPPNAKDKWREDFTEAVR